MNIHFFAYTEILLLIIAVAVVLIAIALLAGFYYVISILRALKHISGKAEQVSDDVSDNVRELHDNLVEHGLRLRAIFAFFKKLRMTWRRARRSIKPNRQ